MSVQDELEEQALMRELASAEELEAANPRDAGIRSEADRIAGRYRSRDTASERVAAIERRLAGR